jgi:membrane protein DedA with SNARE-associated domain
VILVSGLGSWSYLAIFLGARVDCTAFLGVLVPGEALVVFGGVLAARGGMRVEGLHVVTANSFAPPIPGKAALNQGGKRT